MFVKICGLTDRTAVRAAVEGGADAIGFVFAPSLRSVTADRAVELAAEAPRGIARVAVFRHPERGAFADVVERLRPDFVQTDAEDFAALALPAETAALPVLRNGFVRDEPLPACVLFEGARSGAGTKADWEEARALARRTRLVLAGGLDADNVAAAIELVRPWGVDVSTGVEHAPGRKDPEKIKRFIARVRALEA
jgi:phosphoribosylanthranilate isomerase